MAGCPQSRCGGARREATVCRNGWQPRTCHQKWGSTLYQLPWIQVNKYLILSNLTRVKF